MKNLKIEWVVNCNLLLICNNLPEFTQNDGEIWVIKDLLVWTHKTIRFELSLWIPFPNHQIQFKTKQPYAASIQNPTPTKQSKLFSALSLLEFSSKCLREGEKLVKKHSSRSTLLNAARIGHKAARLIRDARWSGDLLFGSSTTKYPGLLPKETHF